MKKIVSALMVALVLFSCKPNYGSGKFTVAGEIKGLPDQKVYLEELFFSGDRQPEVLDTAEVKGGKFSLSAMAVAQGIYRLRLEKDRPVFVLINDQNELELKADYSNLSMKTITINSPANALLKSFIQETDARRTALKSSNEQLKAMPDKTDSTYQVMEQAYNQSVGSYENYIIRFIDSTTNPIVAVFALGYTRQIDPEKLTGTVAGLSKRFPGNATVITVSEQFKQMQAQAAQQKEAEKARPQIGTEAPDLSMLTPDGKTLSLSSLKGKFVLVDFWASWCGPCRQENPNVVKAYNAYKDKNFTVLGVSLDKNKAFWEEAIKTDGLAWNHISDLKQWDSDAVGKYAIDGIPYNVLVDPQGKIIAEGLRGQDLEDKLAEVLK